MFVNCLKMVVQFQDTLWQNLQKYLPTIAKSIENEIPQWVKRPQSNNPYHNLTVTYDFFSGSHLDGDDFPLAPALGYFCNYLGGTTAGEFIFTEHNVIVPFSSTGTFMVWFGSKTPHATGKYPEVHDKEKKVVYGHLGTSIQIKKSFLQRVLKRDLENWQFQNKL